MKIRPASMPQRQSWCCRHATCTLYGTASKKRGGLWAQGGRRMEGPGERPGNQLGDGRVPSREPPAARSLLWVTGPISSSISVTYIQGNRPLGLISFLILMMSMQQLPLCGACSVPVAPLHECWGDKMVQGLRKQALEAESKVQILAPQLWSL